MSSIWSIAGDKLIHVREGEEPLPIVLVPNEDVLVLAIELPPMASAARRRLALPFAVEDRIADPLGAVHVALGIEIAPRIWLAGVVRHELMRRWLAMIEAAGVERARIVPDAMTLAQPAPGCWTVDIVGGRALIRAMDGTGFAVPLTLLEPAWRAAGAPPCIADGEPLPPAMATIAEQNERPIPTTSPLVALDLRQGTYAAPRRAVDPLWRRVATVAALGAAAHGAIAIADTLALDRIAARRDAEVRTLAASTQPNLALGPDLETALADMTPDAAANAPSAFLTLLSRTGAALAGSKLPVSWRSTRFDRAAGTLTIELETGSIADLQKVAQALTTAGLVAQPGNASTDQGRAVGTFVVRAA